MIDGQSTDLLGRHVADGAEHQARLGLRWRRPERARGHESGLVLRQFREPEIKDLDAVISSDEEILGLEGSGRVTSCPAP